MRLNRDTEINDRADPSHNFQAPTEELEPQTNQVTEESISEPMTR